MRTGACRRRAHKTRQLLACSASLTSHALTPALLPALTAAPSERLRCCWQRAPTRPAACVVAVSCSRHQNTCLPATASCRRRRFGTPSSTRLVGARQSQGGWVQEADGIAWRLEGSIGIHCLAAVSAALPYQRPARLPACLLRAFALCHPLCQLAPSPKTRPSRRRPPPARYWAPASAAPSCSSRGSRSLSVQYWRRWRCGKWR